MRRFKYLGLLVLVALALPFSVMQAQEQNVSNPIKVELIAEDQWIEPGHPFWVGIAIDIQPGWHIYWKNPGESGLPTSIEWNLPENVTVETVEWPAPEKFTMSSLVGYGYSEPVVLLAKITPSKEFQGQNSASIQAVVKWVACKDACIPGSQNAVLTMSVKGELPIKDSQHQKQFAKARDHLPHDTVSATIGQHQDNYLLNFKLDKNQQIPSQVYFFPEQEGIIDSSKMQELKSTTHGSSITLPLQAASSGKLENGRLKGILNLGPLGNVAVDLPIAAHESPSLASELATVDFSTMLLLAFLGGLILNLMPCVLPVISLKLLNFVESAKGDRKQTKRYGLSFAAGMIASFWALTGVLIGLRAGGESIGWGFQLQEPIFVIVLAALLFILSLSLFGVFELGLSLTSLGGRTSNRNGLISSFFSGVLATAVATPCTGPLLGSAVGFAITLPPISAFLIFTSIALGMALPYLLISFFPRLISYIPKPGPWMVTFKQLMGFLMLGTVLWLLWVLNAQVNSTTLLTSLLIALLVISIGCWIYGRWGSILHSKRVRYLAQLLSVSCVALGLVVAFKAAHDERSAEALPSSAIVAKAGQDGWIAWDPELLEQLRSEGTPVLVDFTAKWCLVCQANMLVLNSSEVENGAQKIGLVKMKADWTRKDPRITNELEKFGRNGVPLYVIYSADPQQQPVILPQILTPAILADAFEKAQ